METIQKGDIELKLIDMKNSAELFRLTNKNRMHLRKALAWVDGVQTEDDSKKYISNSLEEHSQKKKVVFEIWYQNTFAGLIDFHNISVNDKSAEVGYWIDEDFQGKGIITDACRLLMNYGFESLNLNRIGIQCAATNQKSAAVAQRLGYIKEGILREAAWLYDHFEDMEIWSLLKSEYKK